MKTYKMLVAAVAMSLAPLVSASAGQTPTIVTPEPATYVLMAVGLAGLGIVARRRRK